MALDKSIVAINYAVETVNRTIYLIGIAQNRSELTRVVAHANGINRVKQQKNYVDK